MTSRFMMCRGWIVIVFLFFAAPQPSVQAGMRPTAVIPALSQYGNPVINYSWLTQKHAVKSVLFMAGALIVVMLTFATLLSGDDSHPAARQETGSDTNAEADEIDRSTVPEADIVLWAIHVIMADGKLSHDEFSWLAEFAESKNVPWKLVTHTLGEVRAGWLKAPAPKSTRVALLWLDILIGGALADGCVSKAEGKVLMEIAAHLKMSKSEVLCSIRKRRAQLAGKHKE